MKRSLAKVIRGPKTCRPLKLAAFKVGCDSVGEESIIEGILYDEESGDAYPILHGVPVMLDSRFPREFLDKHAAQISQLEGSSRLQLSSDASEGYSFSTQWDQFFEGKVERTWGWTVEERVEQFLMETQVDQDWCKGKLVLDAGCGNGTLSEAISLLGAEVVALDFSSSVFQAEQRRKSSQVSFVQGDLRMPPFDLDAFDLVISIGVLHHTPNTYKTFSQVAKVVKPGGLFYLWLYRRPDGFLRRYLKSYLFDLVRVVTSRLPPRPQALVVTSYARLVQTAHKLLRSSSDVPFSEYVVSAYDDLTPRWRHYHTPFEVSSWFYQNGFSALALTHWDNPYGFGCVARKTRQASTPGIHYGIGAKLWDDRHTIIG